MASFFAGGSIVIILSLFCCASFAQEPTEVIVAHAEKKKWFDTIEALGTLSATETVALTASVVDTITHIHFEDGQRVDKGDVLAEMTSQEESALVQEMTARVAEAETQLGRLKALPNKGAVSESLFDQREREFEAAKAQLEAMKSRLQDRLIIAPFAGVLGLRRISVGALVEPGTEIVTLTDDSAMKLDFNVPSVFLNSLKAGLPIVATTEAFPDRDFEGRVSGIDSRVDPVTRSVTVRAIIPNADRLLRPGLLMSVKLRHRFREAVSIPESALIPKGTLNEVIIINEESKKATVTDVEVGARRVGEVELTKGLNAGQLVVTHGTQKVSTDQIVTIKAHEKRDGTIREILSGVPAGTQPHTSDDGVERKL